VLEDNIEPGGQLKSTQNWVRHFCLFLAGLNLVLLGSNLRAQESKAPRSTQQKYSDGFVITLYDVQKRDQQFEQILASLATSRIRHLSFGVIATQANKRSNRVSPDTLQNEWVLNRVARLKSMGYTTSLIPILYGTEDSSWRGHFEPQNPSAWLSSYSDWIMDLARQGETAGVSELSVASEMNQMYRAHENAFIVLMNRVRRVFTGPIFVTLNSLSEIPDSLIRAGDMISVSAYVPLRRPWYTRSCETLLYDYVSQLNTLSQRFGRTVHITEIGYPSVQTGLAEPWNFSAITDPRLAISDENQKCGYEAIVGAMGQARNIHRIQLWELTDTTAPDHPKSYSPVNKPAWTEVQNLIQTRSQLSQ